MLIKIWAHLSGRRRIQLILLLLVMLASGGAEILSLGAVLPFLAVLSDPVLLWQQPLVEGFAGRFGLTDPTQLLLPASFLFAGAAVLAALIRISNLWLNCRLAAAIGSDLSCEAYRRTLYQPYEVHVKRNSSAIITVTTAQIGGTISTLNALLQLITSSVVSAALIIALLIVDAPVALSATILFGASYVALAFTARRELRSNGKKIIDATNDQLKALQEGLGAVRDVLLNGDQPTYLGIYRRADRLQRQLGAQNRFLSRFPRYMLEALGIAAIALLGGMLVLQQSSGATVIPVLGTLALGAQRLLPSLQQIYGGWASIKSQQMAVFGVIEMLNQPLPPQVTVTKPLPFRHCIRLAGVRYRYSSELPDVLRDLDLEVFRGERVGLIGSTGSGKSTTVDLLMGLLPPSSGRVLIDGEDLHDPSHPQRLVAWRAGIAHVPQSIYLADSSIAENIAFGLPRHQINMDRVRYVSEQAQIAAFVESNSEGYESFVGERGIRLSGGQRQRIGIARALYRRAQLIVFDEATSALDNETEAAVIEAIQSLSRDLTLIMIAHRLTTLDCCDRVIDLGNGVS